MVRIEITKHAYDRMKEWLGLNKKAATRMAEIAYSDGIKHGDTSGQLYRYISAQAYAYMKKGYCLKIYGEAVYCFINGKDEEKDAIQLVTFAAHMRRIMAENPNLNLISVLS